MENGDDYACIILYCNPKKNIGKLSFILLLLFDIFDHVKL